MMASSSHIAPHISCKFIILLLIIRSLHLLRLEWKMNLKNTSLVSLNTSRLGFNTTSLKSFTKRSILPIVNHPTSTRDFFYRIGRLYFSTLWWSWFFSTKT
ncbi:hypothetical protein HanPSC8_Chr09g0375911 [Helianthus annuus]|nr:hypothetical protein HanPSC8_Chr09g0375911 [Helianthus annuus]